MSNPYLSPGQPPGQQDTQPKWFQPITIGYAFLAGLAVLGGLGAIAGLAMSRSMVDTFPTMPPSMPMGRVREFQAQMLEAQMPWLQGPFGLVEAIVAGWALYTAIRIMQRRPGSVGPFRSAAIAFAATALVGTALDVVVQIRTMSIMQDFMREMMRAAPLPSGAGAHGFDDIVQRSMLGGAILGVIWAVAWLGAKLWLTLYARYYVTKEPVRAYLDDTR